MKAATACRVDVSGPRLEAESLVLSVAATYGDRLIFAHEKLYTPFGECIFGPEDEPPLKLATVRKGRSAPVFRYSGPGATAGSGSDSPGPLSGTGIRQIDSLDTG